MTQDEEKARYQYHQNNTSDLGYINFLMKFITPFQSYLSPSHKKGLDYGAGPTPVLASIFHTNNYEMDVYDPFFYPFFSPCENIAKRKGERQNYYDFITCTESSEHFYNPIKEFERMVKILKPNGVLGLMTQFAEGKNDDNFAKWWYKNDPTHVSFFSTDTFHYIAHKYQLRSLAIDSKNGLVFFQKRE